jgi:hypothetical protein
MIAYRIRLAPQDGVSEANRQENWTMKNFRVALAATCLAGALATAGVALADDPAAMPKGEAVLATAEVTATVIAIDHKTRNVTLRADDGREISFVASEDVQNLPQVQPGDLVTVAYMEALAYEVKKGGKVADAETVIGGGAAEAGAKPAGAIARQTTMTVLITAIDPKVPSVTFQGPGGNSRTIKVRHPEKLQGVSVGDTVELAYTEAVALKVEAAPKK